MEISRFHCHRSYQLSISLWERAAVQLQLLVVSCCVLIEVVLALQLGHALLRQQPGLLRLADALSTGTAVAVPLQCRLRVAGCLL